MSLIENKFKYILKSIEKDVKQSIDRKKATMVSCVEGKLQNTLDMYKDELNATCNYILTRNPITISGEITKVVMRDNNKEN